MRRIGSDPKSELGGADLTVLLGSGLGGACERFPVVRSLEFEQIPGLTPPSVSGHRGEFRLCSINDRRCLFIVGRKHYYERADKEIRAMVRFAAALGTGELVLTSAAGSVDSRLSPGELVVVEDIMDFQDRDYRLTRPAEPAGRSSVVPRPLRGGNSPLLCLDPSLRSRIEKAAIKAGIALKRGVLACVSGPAYETPAEVRALQEIGASLVTMSAAPEVFFANQAGLRVAALCLVTNLATGLAQSAPSHKSVLEIGKRSSRALGDLIVHLVRGPDVTAAPDG
ncbi:MAG: hypothetical protein GTO51_09245 [Candidatus Latescibacteria bacterium]|nr:hypothetical protein [Candidatus Latescibacterota bacterium]NIM22328.1 hypothetical protein [Candidatus Latescibacterota bacterium]NIM66157.1 hypothetical protein [Candidatus Latescibacterota bacterium]NIO02565.1 hypothetical protein [Candidatus Latescibacterota bacterium]NIO29479.1 hypothetical protein [Candidatus Latescibacterota bacterium]